MSAAVNHSKEQCLIKITQLLDASFGNQSGPNNHLNVIRNSIAYLRNSLAFEMTEEVAQLVLKEESEESIKELLKRNFPSGVSIGNVEEMLKLVYIGTDADNLKKAINFVQIFDCRHHAKAYNALYEDVKFKEHTDQPEMLLLQKKFNQIGLPVISTVLVDTIKTQVNADCRKIISRIVKEIKEKDQSLSIYVAKELDIALLNDNIGKIVQEFFKGTTIQDFLLLIQYSLRLPYMSNQCFLIDAVLKELEKRKLLESVQAMHIWAHAMYQKKEQSVGSSQLILASTQKLCTDAIEKLSLNKEKFFGHYQIYVEDANKQKIKDLHSIAIGICSQ
jgi:hypothetical protein